MTRTAAADAVLPACSPAAATAAAAAAAVTACRRAAAACPAAGTAIAPAGSAARPDRPADVHPLLVRPSPGPPDPPGSEHAGPLHRRLPVENAVTLAGWPADPGRDV
jgi:hypothetical protein